MTDNHYRRRLAAVRADFERNTTDHELTVLMDRSADQTDPQPYRHLRIAAPGTRIYSWDILTWPGHLATAGDIADGYTFARIHDMAEFFVPRPEPYRINPEYWAEKLAHSQRGASRTFSVEALLDHLGQQLDDEIDGGALAEWAPEHLEALRSSLRKGLTHAYQWAPATPVDAAYQFLQDWSFTPDAADLEPYRISAGLELAETMETGYELDYHLLLALHAITTGIEMYRAQQR